MTTLRSVVLFFVVACAGRPRGETPLKSSPDVIELDASPNGLWWDEVSRTLLVADDAGSRIVAWDGAATRSFALPAEGRGGLGQVVKLADGTIVVPRFGHGETGAILVIGGEGAARAVPDLDPKRRRLGVAPAPDGGVFVAYFEPGEGGKVGVLAEVTLSGGERDLVRGLRKPVGLAISDNWLYVSDQDAGQILRCWAADCGALEPLVSLAAPDLIAAGPNGSIVVASKGGTVTLVCADGDTRELATGTTPTRGVAYDGEGHRLFIAEHPDDGGKGRVRVLPLEPGDCASIPAPKL